MPANPFDWTGPEFLLLYIALLIGVVAFSLRKRSGGPESYSTRPLTAVELGYLAGGPKRAADTIMMQLFSAGVATVAKSGVAIDRDAAIRAGLVDSDWPPASGTISRSTFQKRVQAQLAAIGSQLAERGLVLSRENVINVRMEHVLVFGALTAFAVMKMMVGVGRGKPIGFLVMLAMVTLVIGLVRVVQDLYRTRAGDRELGKYRSGNARAARAPVPSELALAFALSGAAVLVGTPYAAYAAQIRSAGGGSSGCSGGGSDGGGGCSGGGGCGGCGG